jgi:sortase B
LAKSQKKKKTTFGDVLSVIILIVAIAVMAVAGFKLYKILMEYKAGSDEYANISNMVVKERDPDKEEVQKLTEGESEGAVKTWNAPISVDFNQLKAINEDVVGWIYMEAIPDINYPIVHAKDNDFYLHRTYKKEDNFAGTIFIDAANSPDFSDQNTIVYGHNMKNGSMFGKLKQYKTQETMDASKYFWILTPQGDYKYQIFSVYTAPVDGSTYTLIKGPGKETIEYGDKMKGLSLWKDLYTKPFIETDNFVTLSTCTGDTSTRFVVQGVRIYPE